MYEDLVNFDLKGHRTWVTKARTIFHLQNVSGIQNSQYPQGTSVTSIPHVKFVNDWLKNINNTSACPKLRTYCLYKSKFIQEKYFTCMRERKHMIALARFRTSSHNLHIEVGRHTSPITPLEKRICKFCNSRAIDDEVHFILDCNFHSTERSVFLNTASNIIPFSNVTKHDIFAKIMSCNSPILLNALGKFVYNGFQKRERPESPA